MRRVSAWISLEPDAWALRNNRYPATSPQHGGQEHPEQPGQRQDQPEQAQPEQEQGQEQEGREQEQGETLSVPQEEATTLSDGREHQQQQHQQQQHQQQQQQQQEHVHEQQQQQGPGALPALTVAEKASAARECKRLLDGGRMCFLQERLGLQSEVVHFVEREVTPENALLLGFR